MNKISTYPKTTLRISTHNRRAVSDVVAVLILIVIAIIGAVAVGLILSTTSHSVGSQAASNGNGQSATQQLLLGGSTTLYPADQAAIPAFETTYPGIKVIDAQGGSDAGMQGILSGALDVGAASSIVAVNNLYNAINNNNVVGVTPDVTLVGGSGVVFGTTSLCTVVGATTCTTVGATISPAPLYDGGSGSGLCLELTRDAVAKMYALGTFYIATGGCTAATNGGNANVLDASCIAAVAAGPYTLGCAAIVTGVGPFVSVSRSDFGGTEDTACGYLKGVQGLSYTSGSGICGKSLNVGSGNLGVLQTTQTCASSLTSPSPVGCIGFFDFGFAEGKSPQAAATCSSAAGGKPCNIFIAEVSTGGPSSTITTTLDPLQEVTASGATSSSSYAFTGDKVSNIDTFIKSALKTAATQNPQTLQYSQASSLQIFFPDPAASSASNPLDRTFYYVTNGTPTSAEQDWISFMTNYNAESYWLGAGY